jgi:Mg-chelatase subunit ChlD
MTAADITRNLEINDPTKEVVVITVTDGETYISKKFSTVTAVNATWNESVATAIAVSYSGATVTVIGAGINDKLCCLTIYGRD